jgi:hypothetical protein
MLIALIAFFPTPPNGAIGSLDYTPKEKHALAKSSGEWTCELCKKKNSELLADLTDEQKEKQMKSNAEDKETLSSLTSKAAAAAQNGGTVLSPLQTPTTTTASSLGSPLLLSANNTGSTSAAVHGSTPAQSVTPNTGQMEPLLMPAAALTVMNNAGASNSTANTSTLAETKDQAAIANSPAVSSSTSSLPASPLSVLSSRATAVTPAVLLKQEKEQLLSLLTVLLSFAILILLIRKYFFREH